MGDEKISVTDAEIKHVEQQVKQAEQSERAKLEENIRKEFAAEQRARDLESQLAIQTKAAEEAKSAAIKAKEEAEAIIASQVEQRLKQAQDARSKQPVNTTNPFRGSESKPVITPDMYPSIGVASFEALRDRSNNKNR